MESKQAKYNQDTFEEQGRIDRPYPNIKIGFRPVIINTGI